MRRYQDARIIFIDTEVSNWTFDPVRGQFYWHRFFSHQPDLNYENPEVQDAMLEVLRFWLDLGLDGFRLDAVPYLFEEEGTNCENLPRTHEYLKRVRAEIDERYPDRVLLAEANQWPEDVVEYFGDGDECHMAFHFPVMPRMFMSLRREEALPMIEILDRTPPIPTTPQWGLFLRNHDELTLEMVTDEERDYMYSEYAKDPRMKLNVGIRRRLAPLLDGGRDEIELMHAILFSLPGSPVLYYGDEISDGRQRLPRRPRRRSHADAVDGRPKRRLLACRLRAALPAAADGSRSTASRRSTSRRSCERRRRFCAGCGASSSCASSIPSSGAASTRRCGPRTRRSSPTSARSRRTSSSASTTSPGRRRRSSSTSRAFTGRVPVEMFGNTEFPRIGELPYLLTLGPRGFFWFQLQDPADERLTSATRIDEGDLHFLDGLVLLGTIASQRWFGGKSRDVLDARVLDAGVAPGGPPLLAFAIVEVRYGLQSHDLYHLPLGFRPEADDWKESIVAETRGWTVYDAIADPELVRGIVGLMRREATLTSPEATLLFRSTGDPGEPGEHSRRSGRWASSSRTARSCSTSDSC